jgi:uncharacterized protein (UPF0262 family)
MPLVDVRVEVPEGAASDARRAEWRIATAELRRYAVFLFPGVADPWILHVHVASGDIALSAVREHDGAPLLALTVPDGLLLPAVAAYVDVVRRLHDAGPGAAPEQIAALDAQKRAAHDAGAGALGRALPPLGADHETLRRLFSLLVSVRLDTTRLFGVFGHRPVR